MEAQAREGLSRKQGLKVQTLESESMSSDLSSNLTPNESGTLSKPLRPAKPQFPTCDTGIQLVPCQRVSLEMSSELLIPSPLSLLASTGRSLGSQNLQSCSNVVTNEFPLWP